MTKEISDVFPEEYKQPFLGLLYVGKLQRTIEVAGHKILIRTLTQGEELRVAQLTKEYVGTRGEIPAMQTYLVAAAIETVDGKTLMNSLSPDADPIATKVETVKNWYASVVQEIYVQYADMVKSAKEVARALKN